MLRCYSGKRSCHLGLRDKSASSRPAHRHATAVYAQGDHATAAISAAAAAPGALKSASRCPFAGAASFLVTETAGKEPAVRSPLTAAGGVEAASAHLWLAAGVSGQDIPVRLVSGLRNLQLDEFLIELPRELQHELELKRRAFDNPSRRTSVIAAEANSVAAQAECLELFLEYLPQRYTSLYTMSGEGEQRRITVHPTNETYTVADFRACPLELCARLVQEDLVLMRADTGATATTGTATDTVGKKEERYVMSAAVVVFSFAGLADKLSKPLPTIHVPVPGFQAELNKLLAKTFSGLRPERPLWRNNWGLADTGQLDSPLYGTQEAFESRSQGLKPHERWLKTEYQTLRRLPRTDAVLFTVRTMVEPLPALAAVPGAAACLAASLRGMSPAMRAYKGLGASSAAEDMLVYLDSLAGGGQH